MQRLSSRLLLSQVGISFLVSFLLGLSTLTLARGYFIDAMESALDVQARLVGDALFPTAKLGETTLDIGEFNTVQQQIANLGIEVQRVDSEDSASTDPPSALTQSIQAFEAIELLVAYADVSGEIIIRPDSPDLPPSFSNNSTNWTPSRRIEQGHDHRRWLVKSYPVMVGSAVEGTLSLGQPLEALEIVLIDLGWRIAAAGSGALLIATVVSWLSARGLIAPIKRLMKASEALSQGAYDPPLPLGRKDELGELSRTFAEMRDKLAAHEALRTQFISDVSHELRTPLTAIKGLAETLQDGAVDDPLVRDRFLNAIEIETDRLIRMTLDLLTLTRVDANSLTLSHSTCDLDNVIQDLLLTLSQRIDAKRLGVDITFPAPSTILYADQDRLKQILFNLLDNAIQHSPDESRLRIYLTRGWKQDPHILEILDSTQLFGGHKPPREGLEDSKQYAILTIQDDGLGIPADELPHVFERFYRADTARQRSVGGAGLGLSIASALADLHGYFLWIESPTPKGEDRGTQARLLFPVQSE